MLQRIVLFLIFFTLSTFVYSQVPFREIYTTWEDFLEHYTDEKRFSNDEIEHLSLLKEQPINLNTTDKEGLLQLPFLSEEQIDSLLAYRQMKRHFLKMFY